MSVAIRLGDIEVQEGAEIPARILSRRFLGNSELLQLAVSGHEVPVSTRVRCGLISEKSRDIAVFVQKDRALVFERLNESA